MKRLLAFFVLLVALLAGGVAWLLGTEAGLQSAVRLAGAATGGQLQIEGATGRLLGPMELERIQWKAPDLSVDIVQVRLDWTPAALLERRLAVTALSVARIGIVSPPNDDPLLPPEDLTLPVAVDLEKVRISEIAYGDAVTVSEVRARLVSDGRQHRVEDLEFRVGRAAVSGTLALDGLAPMPLHLDAEMATEVESHPVRVKATAQGPLAVFDLALSAEAGIRGQGEVQVTPFAAMPFARAAIRFSGIDPAAWVDGAPKARFDLDAEIRPAEKMPEVLEGRFRLDNGLPGRVDDLRLPLVRLDGRFSWQDDELRLEQLAAQLPGGGRLGGKGKWRAPTLALDLEAQAVDAAQLLSHLQTTRLNGPLRVELAEASQSVNLRLSDARFVLSAEANHAGGRLDVRQLELAAGDSRVRLAGMLETAGKQAFSVEGELIRFDPSRFVRVPAASLNGSLSASGRLAPQPTVDGRFVLRDSRVADQSISGDGQLAVAWPRIPRADIRLQAGPNRLETRGAFGGPGDQLQLEVAAPELKLLGLNGRAHGQFTIAGTVARPVVSGALNVPYLGLSGRGRIKDGMLNVNAGSEPLSPLNLALKVGVVETATQPGLVKGLQLRVEGTRRAHHLDFSADVAAGHRVDLALDGGLGDDLQQPRWQGQLTRLGLSSSARFRSFSLAQPADFLLAGDAWRLGPLVLAGDPWRLRLVASADAQRAHLESALTGERIGEVTARLDAGMRGAWSMNPDAGWQGQLHADVPDLAWIGELLTQDIGVAGRLGGDIKLGGTPGHPVVSGRLSGSGLGVSIPETGMRLAQGVLDARLDDNLLQIGQLSFDSVLVSPPKAMRRGIGEPLEAIVARPGRLEIGGKIRVDRDNESAALEIRMDRLGVFQLSDRWVSVSGDARLSWMNDVLTLRGQATTDAAYWELGPMGAPRLSDDVVILGADGKAQPAGFRPIIDLDIEGDLGRHFMFSGLGLETRLAGRLRIQAQGRDLPRATGRIRTQGGRFEAYGQQLEISRGILTFQGLIDNPAIDALAVRRGLPVEPGVMIGGTVQRPVVRLVSTPEVPDVEKLSWLILGHGPEQGGAGAAGLLVSAAGSLFGNDSGGLVRQIKQGFGIDEFTVRQGTLGDTSGNRMSSRVVGSSFDTGSSTSDQILSVGRRISRNVLLSYDQSLGRAGSVVKLTIALNRQVSVIARAGSDNALDMIYTFVFGLPPSQRNRQEAATR